MSGQSGDSPANVRRTQLVFGKSLHRMGYHGAAMGWLSRVVEAKPEHDRKAPAIIKTVRGVG